ncbi:MAG: helix-turn-helix transcriptional regulator [Pseudomonadota bacterium]
MPKSPNPIDVHVGARLRERRMLLGISQEKLGDNLGLTFQQIQKYEKGVNRIGASRLFQIAQFLDAPVQYFFEGAPGEAEETPEMMRFLGTVEGLQLNAAFTKIKHDETRRRIVELVKTLSESEGPLHDLAV